MELQATSSANIRNISIANLSGYKQGRRAVETLKDEIAARSRALEAKDDFTNAACAKPRDHLGVGVSFNLDTGSSGHSFSSFSLPSAETDGAHADVEGQQQSQAGPLTVNVVTCPERGSSPHDAVATRVTDSILMVVGVDDYTISPRFPDTVRAAVREACKPVIFLDRIDEVLFMKTGNLQPEDLCNAFCQTIVKTNRITHDCPGRPSNIALHVDPRDNTVLFGSTAAGWGFSINQFAELQHAEPSVENDELRQNLWEGFMPEISTQTEELSVQGLRRAFNKLIIAPIFEIRAAVLTSPADPKPLETILERLGVTLRKEHASKHGQELFNIIMRAYLPIGRVLESVIRQMPSPLEAQSYRTACLYSGPSADGPGMSMMQCEREAPLLMYATHFVPAKESKEKLYLFGRIFAGTISAGQDVAIQEPSQVYWSHSTPGKKTVAGVFTIALGENNTIKPVVKASAGDLVFLSGLDTFMQRSGTIDTGPQTRRIRDLYFLRPTIQYKIQVQHSEKLPRLVAGFDFLCKTDLLFESSTTSNGSNLVFWFDTDDVEANLDLLRSFADDPLVIEGPRPTYQETITAESSQIALSKSPNKHNRFYASASPLDEDVTSAIEAGIITPMQDHKARAEMLRRDFSWEENAARKIWGFGPASTGPNVVVDETRAVQFLFEIRDSFLAAFQWASGEGPLIGARLRGVRLNIRDVMMFSDAIHRGAGQVMPPVRRVTFASILLAKPILVEPKYLVHIQVSKQHVAKVHNAISEMGGAFCPGSVQVEHVSGGIWETAIIQAHVPLAARLRLELFLRQETDLLPRVSIVQAGWQAAAEGDPLDTTSPAGRLLRELRKENDLPPEIEINLEYLDKL